MILYNALSALLKRHVDIATNIDENIATNIDENIATNNTRNPTNGS